MAYIRGLTACADVMYIPLISRWDAFLLYLSYEILQIQGIMHMVYALFCCWYVPIGVTHML